VSDAAKLRSVVAVHCVLATAHVWTPLLPMRLAYGLAEWSLLGISTAPGAMLGLWCALGSSHPLQRLWGGAGGVVFFAGCTVLREAVRRSTLRFSYRPIPDVMENELAYYARQFGSSLAIWAAMFLIFVGLLMLARLRLGRIQRIGASEDAPPAAPAQFSIQYLFAAVTLAAVVCGLSRGACYSWDWQGPSQQGLYLIAKLAVTVIAAWAALALGPTRGRLWRAVAFAALVGMAYSIAMPTGDWNWWKVAWWWILFNGVLWTAPLAAILIVSLLVVRSCGYRLVPRPN